MDYPDWFDVEWEDFDKPCPECGGAMRSGPMFDQGCYEGMVYRCTAKKCQSQWVFRLYGWIPPYWFTPPCPACESLYADYEHTPGGGLTYTCLKCKATYTDARPPEGY